MPGKSSLSNLLSNTRVWAVATALLVLASCSSSKRDDIYVERPAEEFYNLGLSYLGEGDYAAAARNFDEVERQHPYSVWAPRAQLMTAYTHYQADSYDEAINTLDRFIQLHPGHPDIAYAYYLKAISYYEQIADVERDQSMTRQAMQALEEVVTRFPETNYARDATLKLDLARDHLAAIGRQSCREG